MMEKNNLRYVKLKLKIPGVVWIHRLSTHFPNEVIYLNYSNALSENERQVFLSTSSKKNLNLIYDVLKEEKQVENLQMVGSNIRLTFKLNFLQKMLHQRLTIIFPVIIQNGYGVLELFADKLQIELFKQVFSQVEILKISDEENKKEQLTQKQKNLIETAYMLGYFSYPRKISLTQLAKNLNVSKSTLSENLRTAENKIISNYYRSAE